MVVNRDTSPTAQTVLIKKSTIVLTADTPLGTGETLEYLGDRGWKVLDRQGKVKTQSAMSGPGSRLALGPCAAGMGTQSRVHANTQFWIVYVGKSPRYPVTSMQVRWRTTVAAVGTVWAELAILTGTTPHAANGAGTMSTVQARVLGHANVSPQVDSIGIHNTTINTLTGIVIPPDEDVWIGFNSEFNTSGCTLSSSMSDDVISGAIALSTTVFRRPSVDLGQTLAIPGLLVLTVFPTFQVYWT
jgi:hypothetical protein